ncbi:hypothetical protein E2986_12053 [Frieseomelitta varia]|uniref:Copper homeostasis protein cutC homolog n=1 Tax=Frieseomelitta varia TaxID=561572 RepID=A0A833RHT4_9HYME|nr:copper homeostasis protein cutC homolog [Frieseomelitta varia]KAF3424074.1 hypothetical protein E2986_12053 [Frieseomelitta varia]
MEICIDSVMSGRHAITGGATRLEVCSVIIEGGLTPSVGFFQFVSRMSLIPCYAMLRARPGNFIYTKNEIEIMLSDLKALKKSDADGFSFGALTPDGDIDIEACRLVLAAASPLPVNFHRAFDQVRDPIRSLRILIDLGFKRVMTSGHKNTAEEGLKLIKKLVDEAKDKIIVVAASGITKDNILKIHSESGVKEFHSSASRKMEIERNKVKVGFSESNYVMATDKKLVQTMVDAYPVPEEPRHTLLPKLT